MSVPDAGFAACLHGAVGPDFTEETLAWVTYLTCENGSIKDLTGAQYLVNIGSLDLDNWGEATGTSNEISNLAPLAHLQKLESLSLEGNKVSNLSPLAGLGELQWLDLASNQITTLTPLAGLDNLDQLYLGGNQISDTAPLGGLPALTLLDLSGNQISDVAPLVGLTTVIEIDLSENRIANVSALANAGASLKRLTLDGNRIWDISPLSALDLDGLFVSFQSLALTVTEGEPTPFPLRNLQGKLPAEVVIPWVWSILDGKLTAFTPENSDPDGDDDIGKLRFDDGASGFFGSLDITVLPGTVRDLTTSDPVIVGSPVVGQTLRLSMGSWGPAPVHLEYAWTLGDDTDVGTDTSYVVQPADLGHTIEVWVVGEKLGYRSALEVSDPTDPVTGGEATKHLSAVVPKVSGTAKVGATLTAVPGTWKPSPVTFGYQWLRDGVEIDGATTRTYVVPLGDLAATLQVEVAGTKPGYEPATRVSKVTKPVGVGDLSAVVPRITGVARMGENLTAAVEAWGPGVVSLAPQWLRSGKVIVGATGWTYPIVAADVGKRLAVRVTGTADGYATASRASKQTGKVKAGALAPTPVPVVSGTAQVGASLTVDPGTWGPAGVATTQQWYRSGKKIGKATGLTYQLAPADKGRKITVKVTGRLAGYGTVTKASVATAKVVAGTLSPTPVPTITGTAQAGLVLTVDPGSWGPTPVALATQWYREGKKISRATRVTYTPTVGDVGRTLTVRVTGSRAGYNSVTTESIATQAVEPA